MVIDPAVQGTVDVALRDVPWDQALDIILRANKLGYIVDGTIVRIAPLTRPGRRGDAEAQARRGAGAGRRPARATKTLSYAKAAGAGAAADQERAVAARHRAGRSADQHADHHATCAIGLQTSLDLIADARQAAAAGRDRSADRPDEQELRAGARHPVGLHAARPLRRSATRRTSRFPTACNARRGSRRRAAPRACQAGTAVNLPAAGATSAVGLALGSVNGAFNLDVALSALETQRQRPDPLDAARLRPRTTSRRK